MIQRRRCRELAEGGEIRHVVQDLIPVTRVRDRRQQLQPQRGLLGRLDHGSRGGDDDQHHGERRQQAPGPPGPEVPQVQSPEGVIPGDQQVGDQESGQDEEDVDAEEATRQF
jgi:hypothetical protein